MTEFFEFGAHEHKEEVLEWGSARYEGADDTLRSALWESMDAWQDRDASAWFEPSADAPGPSIPSASGERSAWEPVTPGWPGPETWEGRPPDPWPHKEAVDPTGDMGGTAWWPLETASPQNTWSPHERPAPRETSVEYPAAPTLEWKSPPREHPRLGGPSFTDLLCNSLQRWWDRLGEGRGGEPAARPSEAELERSAAERVAFEEDAARTFVTEVLNVEGVQPEEWRRCDLGERWQMLGTCAQLYCEGFGLENVVLEVDLDLAPGMYGSCQDEGDVTLVTVGGWVLELDHPKEALETLFHELRHAYQFQYVAAAVSAQGQGETNFDLATAAHWQQAMHTYSQRLHTYVNSSIEHDADRHAKDLLNQIYVR